MFMPQRLCSPTPSAGEDWRFHLGNWSAQIQPTEPCNVGSDITSFCRKYLCQKCLSSHDSPSESHFCFALIALLHSIFSTLAHCLINWHLRCLVQHFLHLFFLDFLTLALESSLLSATAECLTSDWRIQNGVPIDRRLVESYRRKCAKEFLEVYF